MTSTSPTTIKRSTRATTKFKHTSKREIGAPKTLVTFRCDDDLLNLLAKEGNAEGLSMSPTIRRVLRRGLGLPEETKPETVAKKRVRKPAAVEKKAPTKAPAKKTAVKKTAAPATPSNVTSITKATGKKAAGAKKAPTKKAAIKL